ncbi:putative short-chain dehydrogenase reductase sdr [Venturia nashicola]|nr:putative short-chain dehydrogenase reductase sdr [Venturia nashicola]
MAASIPTPLKIPDITPFVTRGAQLEKARPVIAYWCEYHVVNQILSKGLHTESDESMTFTTTLMDKLEKFKQDNATNDAVHDDVAAQAYVEQFALDTLGRAENAMKANKATAQTADTFRAASTFLELLGIWQTPLLPEIAAKSKFAKFHAMRIAKALKAGEDPNASNPVQEAVSPSGPPLSPSDPEVQNLNRLQPTVEEADDQSRPPSFIDSRPTPPNVVPYSSQPSAPPQGEVSPLEQSPNGGYFPTAPTFTSENPAPNLPTAAETDADVTMISPSAQDFYNPQPSPPPAPQPHHASIGHPPQAPTPTFQARAPPPHSIPQPFTQQPPQQFVQSTPHFQPQPPVQYQPPSQPPYQPQPTPTQQYRTDDDAVMAAQKHAKWAISALNFEDAATAVKELQLALQALGAR